jgi:formate hydrogenlyase subunit 3/multisubunit Na+/H+ antiporter MnhD subunit
MLQPPPVPEATTAGGYLLVLLIVIPVAGALLAVAVGGRNLERIALATLPLGLAVAIAIALTMVPATGPLVYLLGAWAPPLGVALRADGLSTVIAVITAIVICAIGVYARADFRTPVGSAEARAPFAFWILLLAVWAGLNTAFVAGDLFTLYVALELLTFAAVPLVSLDGRAETLQAALRYLLFALVGSVLYLVGTALLYGAYGTLDIVLLSRRVHAEPATLVAAVLMTVGLLAKTALFPLHLWLPPAHAGAPPAGSAVLSALVVKGSFFIVVRLWFDVMPAVPSFAAMQVLAALGAAAILFGSVVALRQERLKLLIAYSTLAQIGYLFLMFPLAFAPASAHVESGGALSGGMLQAISHATAKAAMFMSAGMIYAALGHDQIAGLGGIARTLPASVGAFALGGLALIGVPPGGAYLAKELLLNAAAETEQWWWAVVIQAGGIFTGAYLVLVLTHALAPADAAPVTPRVSVPWYQQAAALALAICSLLLGLVHWEAYLPVPHGTISGSFGLKTLTTATWPLLAGAVLAILLGRWRAWPQDAPWRRVVAATIAPPRHIVVAVGGALERADAALRQWPAAGLSLLVLVVALGAALLARP